MAANHALEQLLELEQRREDKLAQEFAQAQQHLQQQLQKLSGLEQYRGDYLQQATARGQAGIVSLQLGQYHGFIGKLDAGIQQLSQQLVGIRNAVEQRRQRWLAQRRKREAVSHLLAQRAQAAAQKAAKMEQRQADEFASQRFSQRAAQRSS